ncbi:MAG: glutamate racemase [Bradymonadaceae bacterium]
MDNRPIAIFDSGVGGLTVMRAVVDVLPDEDIIYLGDTARVPYGNRGAETVRRYSHNAAHMLAQFDVKALVIACNTATAYGLSSLRECFDFPMVGVVEPVARAAAVVTQTGEVGVIGTRGTVASGSYPTVLSRLDSNLKVHQFACPLLVPLAEEGWTDGEVVETVLRRYLEPLTSTKVDTLILGCTHYPLLTKCIGRVLAKTMPHAVTLLDSAASTAQSLGEELSERGLLRGDEVAAPSGRGSLRFLMTDLPDGFVGTAERFFGGEIRSYEHIDIIDQSAGPDER